MRTRLDHKPYEQIGRRDARPADIGVRARPSDPAPSLGRGRRAFSLIELIVVMAVAVLLTALTMPAMRQVHENAQRVVCMANQQQMGHAFIIYGGDHNDNLPPSAAQIHNETPQNLMIARRGAGVDPGWDGIGRLFELHYCSAAECFYCPSHHGNHPVERYVDRWRNPAPGEAIFTNYHYAGHMEWKSSGRRRNLLDNELVLLTDGLRTATDFNHVLGMNVLRADCSVRWREDTDAIYELLPKDEQEVIGPAYLSLWDMVTQRR